MTASSVLYLVIDGLTEAYLIAGRIYVSLVEHRLALKNQVAPLKLELGPGWKSLVKWNLGYMAICAVGLLLMRAPLESGVTPFQVVLFLLLFSCLTGYATYQHVLHAHRTWWFRKCFMKRWMLA